MNAHIETTLKHTFPYSEKYPKIEDCFCLCCVYEDTKHVNLHEYKGTFIARELSDDYKLIKAQVFSNLEEFFDFYNPDVIHLTCYF